jgi:hypothetical protein
MTRELHEQVSTFVEEHYMLDDIPMVSTVICMRGDAAERAFSMARQGKRVDLVTTRTTWRGANGKRTTEELSRIPII